MPEGSSLTMYGGHLPSAPPVDGVIDTKSEAHLYFFMIRSRHIADSERTVFWFNGGPGCSSFDGSLMEVGPLRLVPGGKGQLKEVEGAWNEYANMVFSEFKGSAMLWDVADLPDHSRSTRWHWLLVYLNQ